MCKYHFPRSLHFPLHLQATLSGPRAVVLDRVASSAAGAVSCEATAAAFARPLSFQTKRGETALLVVALPAETPPGKSVSLEQLNLRCFLFVFVVRSKLEIRT